MKKLILVITFLFFTSTVHASLDDRGSFAYDDGAGHTGSVNLIYDDDYNITWVDHGNLANQGIVDWSTALDYADNLIIGDFAN